MILKKALRKAFKLADFRNLSNMEILLYLSMFCWVIVSFAFHSKLPILFIFYIVFAIVLFLTIWYHNHKKESTYPKYYGLSLAFFLTVSIVAFYSLLTPNLNAAGYGYVIGFFSFLSAVYILLIYISNFIYLLVLKQIFPTEKENIKDDVEELSLKELSHAMDLDKQKQYLNITVLNILLSVILIGYFALFIMKKSNSREEFEQSKTLNFFYTWLENQESITLFNGISLLSVVITIYVLTFSAQIKIFDEAKKKYTE